MDELEWKRGELEQSVIEVCEVVRCLYERAATRVDYSKKSCLMCSHDGTGSGEVNYPEQIAIDDTTQDIFVADYSANRIPAYIDRCIK